MSGHQPKATTVRYVVSAARLSYKRNGRSGYGWMVIDTVAQGSVAHADTRERAQAHADALNWLDTKQAER